MVQTLVNAQPMHVFVQHHGIHEGKVNALFRETVKEQYERLEKGGDEIEYRFDTSMPGVVSAVMARVFKGGGVTTVHVFAVDTNEARPYWEAQEARKHGAAGERA